MTLRPLSLTRSLVAALTLAAAAGCSTASTSTAPIKLAMVTDVGGLGDRSFNDGAYNGLKLAKSRLGAEIQVLESKSAADYQPNLTVLADQDYDEIYAIGFLMNRDLDRIARNYPRRHFAIIDAVVDEPNVTSVTFREQDGSFLAGALAAMVSKTHTVAFLGGIDIPLLRKFEAGFTAGAHEIDPKADVLVKYVGSFDDVSSGKELAGVLYGQHADIIFVAAGKAGLGAFEEAKSRDGTYVIGVDANQDGLIPGKVLSSMVKHVDNAVFAIAQDALSQKIPSGVTEFGLKDDGVGLTDFKYTKQIIGAKNIATLGALKQMIIAGKIVVPFTREALATWKPVPLPASGA
jgi:basic membrane protein A